MIIVPVGISGSGKSTWSNTLYNNINFIEKSNWTKLEILSISDLDKSFELIKSLLTTNINIIIDTSFCFLSFINEINKLSKEFEIEVIYKLFYCDPELAYKIIDNDIITGVERKLYSQEELYVQYISYKEIVKYLKLNNCTIRGEFSL
jgi:hypothetical protein